VDLDSSDATGQAVALFGELRAASADSQVAYRDGLRYVARLVRASAGYPAAPPALSADGTYLITGGLGSLGIRIAQWMASRGAKNLVLIGRGGPGEEASRAIDGIVEQGARVVIQAGDVAHESDVSKTVEVITATMPPLRGVVHAAGVLDDGVLF